MLLINAQNIKKHFADRTILDFKDLNINSGDKIGIVGDNGAGKTTLLNILAKKIEPSSGVVSVYQEIIFLEQFSDNPSTLSGGEQQKQKLLKTVKSPNLLLIADEPTANLDTNGIKWLEELLQSVNTLLIVSHDRSLLDRICNKIIEVEDGTIREFGVSYSEYVTMKENERNSQNLEYNEYIKKKRQLEQAAKVKEKKKTSLSQKNKRKKVRNSSETRLWKGTMSEVYKQIDREQKILKSRINRLEVKKKIKELPSVHLDFSLTDPPKNKIVVSSDNINFAYGDRAIFKNAQFALYNNEKLAICGENGSGKSTLIKLLQTFNTAPKLKLGYLLQDFSQINLKKTVLENALTNNIQTSDNVYNMLARLLFTGSDLDKKAVVLSGGERTRLLLGMLILSDTNALVLDEPTNFLDIASLEVLEQTLVEYPGTVLFVSHDNQFIENIATRKLLIENYKLIEPFANEKKIDADKILLEFRLDSLVAKLSTVSESEKTNVEKEYCEVLALLKSF